MNTTANSNTTTNTSRHTHTADDAQVMQFGTVTVHLGHKSGKYPDGNQVLVTGGDTRVAFDTPLVAQRIGADFEQADLVILGHVHEDHMAGLHLVPQAQVHVHPADLAAAQSWAGLARHFGYADEAVDNMRTRLQAEFGLQMRPDATAYPEGAHWNLGAGVRVRADHLPGHTSGHCALVVESEGLAFIGDIDLSGFGPYYGDATSSLTEFRQTLAKVAHLDGVHTWVTSHHRAVLTDRGKFLDALAAFTAKIDQRRARLLAMLASGPQPLDALVRQRILYPIEHQAPWADSAERRSIQLHLDELLADGAVRVLDDGRYEALA